MKLKVEEYSFLLKAVNDCYSSNELMDKNVCFQNDLIKLKTKLAFHKNLNTSDIFSLCVILKKAIYLGKFNIVKEEYINQILKKLTSD